MIRSIARTLLLVVSMAVSGACGGGGGGGGGLEVTPAALTFTAVRGGPVPSPQSVHVRQDPELNYGSTFEGLQDPSWLREASFAMIDHSQPEFDHVFAITTTDLAPGTYTTRYLITISEPAPYDGRGPYIPGDTVEEQAIDITYVVTAP